MNIYGPHRYNRSTGKYEAEMYPTISDLVFMPDGSSVTDEFTGIREQLLEKPVDPGDGGNNITIVVSESEPTDLNAGDFWYETDGTM